MRGHTRRPQQRGLLPPGHGDGAGGLSAQPALSGGRRRALAARPLPAGAGVHCLSGGAAGARARRGGLAELGGPFAAIFFASGGMGGARAQDGLSAICFPSNAANTPLEVLEHFLPTTFTRHELRSDSAGRGRWRGGLGQTLEFEVEAAWPVSVAFWTSHTEFTASGLCGGEPGALGAVLLNGEAIDPRRQRLIECGDRVTLHLPGGGGFGPPEQRDVDAMRADSEDGLVRPDAAGRDYGRAVVLGPAR
ncbi:MAG: hydantoinase B/oxoprolinase family protein [Chloroflexi bacterium]|nr:hydantoinase B/oxoprolinase family protein [Chloroflexota bacterium]